MNSEWGRLLTCAASGTRAALRADLNGWVSLFLSERSCLSLSSCNNRSLGRRGLVLSFFIPSLRDTRGLLLLLLPFSSHFSQSLSCIDHAFITASTFLLLLTFTLAVSSSPSTLLWLKSDVLLYYCSYCLSLFFSLALWFSLSLALCFSLSVCFSLSLCCTLCLFTATQGFISHVLHYTWHFLRRFGAPLKKLMFKRVFSENYIVYKLANYPKISSLRTYSFVMCILLKIKVLNDTTEELFSLNGATKCLTKVSLCQKKGSSDYTKVIENFRLNISLWN